MENTKHLDRKVKGVITEIKQVLQERPSASEKDPHLVEAALTLQTIAKKSSYGWDAIRHLLYCLDNSNSCKTLKRI